MDLEIKTRVERPKIKIDGKEYEIKSYNDFTVKDFAWLSEYGEKILSNTKNSDFLRKGIETVTKKILIAPFWIRKKISPTQKIQIINFFLEKVKKEKESLKLFPGSNDSTGEARQTG